MYPAGPLRHAIRQGPRGAQGRLPPTRRGGPSDVEAKVAEPRSPPGVRSLFEPVDPQRRRTRDRGPGHDAHNVHLPHARGGRCGKRPTGSTGSGARSRTVFPPRSRTCSTADPWTCRRLPSPSRPAKGFRAAREPGNHYVTRGVKLSFTTDNTRWVLVRRMNLLASMRLTNPLRSSMSLNFATTIASYSPVTS